MPGRLPVSSSLSKFSRVLSNSQAGPSGPRFFSPKVLAWQRKTRHLPKGTTTFGHGLPAAAQPGWLAKAAQGQPYRLRAASDSLAIHKQTRARRSRLDSRACPAPTRPCKRSPATLKLECAAVPMRSHAQPHAVTSPRARARSAHPRKTVAASPTPHQGQDRRRRTASRPCAWTGEAYSLPAAPSAAAGAGSLGAVRKLSHIVPARMATTTPSETATGILKTSISIILVPMKTRITARP